MTAKDFLKELPEYSKIFDLSIDYQYTEEQLILFAEMYHKSEVKKLNINDVSNCFCIICDAKNSVVEGVCQKCEYSFRDTDGC
tara:strand:- start:1469 stop:1717 length:249 start_codon:yes stop_codon:yes gene_type:complete